MDDATPKKRFPWLKAALAVSLMLNLAALGMLGALMTRAGDQGSVLRSAVAALPEDARRALRRETRDIWREARTGQMRRPVAEGMITALRAEEFDPEAFGASLTAAQERLIRMSDQMHARLIRTVSTMSLEERRAYADALEAQLRQRRWRTPDR